MQTIPFNGRVYSREILREMSLSELVDLYNRAGSVTRDDFSEINKFSDKDTAVRRTWDVLMGGSGEAADPPPPASKSAPRRASFNFPSVETSFQLKTPKQGSLRHWVYSHLVMHARTFEEVVGLVQTYDAQNDVESKNAARRAYEILRILHYQCGFGMQQDKHGRIQLVIPHD